MIPRCVLRTHARVLPLLVLLLAVPKAAPSQTAASGPADLAPEVRARLAQAALDSRVATWQRVFMLSMAHAGSTSTVSASAADLSAVLPAHASSAADGAWNGLSGTPPNPRCAHSAIYDPLRDRMVVFGGSSGNESPLNDVWALSLEGTPAWTQLASSGTPPSARAYHSAIYDPVRDRMVVFGGASYSLGANFNDVWALSLAGTPVWTQLAPLGTPPSARYLHSAIYDAVGDRMVVFGGGGSGSSPLNNDLWALSLAGTPAWTQLAPSGTPPSARSAHSAIYDPVRDRMVVFGGFLGYSPYCLNDIWALSLADAPAWTPLSPYGTPPSARYAHSAVYDPAGGRMVVFGGYSGSNLNDVWALSLGDAPSWIQPTPSGTPPSARYYHSAIVDPARDRMVVFGGGNPIGVLNDGWALTWGTPLPAFGATSASFNKGQYTSGDIATLTVTLKSNWATGPVTVAPTIMPHVGQPIGLPPASGTLTSGCQSSVTFTWSVPSVTGQTPVDVSVVADAGSYGVRAADFSDATVTNELSSAAIQEAQQQVEACGTTSAQLCTNPLPGMIIGAIPFVGTAAAAQSVAQEGCLARQYHEQNRSFQEKMMLMALATDAVAGADGAFGDAADVFCAFGVLPACAVGAGASLIDAVLPNLLTSLLGCISALADEHTAGAQSQMHLRDAAATDSTIASLPDSLARAFAEAGDTLADLAICDGGAHLRIEEDSCFAAADTVGLRGVVVLPYGSSGIQFAAIKPGATRLVGSRSNTTSASTIRLLANSTDSCTFVLLHRRATGEIVKLQYAAFPMDSGGIATVAVSQDSTVFALRVDQNGDGLVDWILYPGGGVTAVSDAAPRPARLALGEARPNPFTSTALIPFDLPKACRARVEIFDVSGRKVAIVVDREFQAGSHVATWAGAEAQGGRSAGVYFARLTTPAGSVTRTLIRLR